MTQFLLIKPNKLSLMKHSCRNVETLRKKNMNLTAQISDVLRSYQKQQTWKSKTNKMTETVGCQNICLDSNPMTEDDIDVLFKNASKSKQAKRKMKVNTEAVETWGANHHKQFVNSVKFLKIQDQHDKLMTGIPNKKVKLIDEAIIDELFESSSRPDLTAKFKKDYQVGKVIGEGAYATVRVALYRPLNRKIAIKIYEKNKIKENQRKKSIRREITILQMLDHPNIVKIYDVVETNNHLNIIMEYLEGISLGNYLKEQPGRRISETTCKKIFKELAKALSYMHSLKIAHRDIKLQNIILDQNLQPKFIDFGFSTCIEPSTKMKIFCGTPSYMAPEVVQRKQYRGETADVWALGVLLFVSLTGLFPFKGSTDQQLYRKINNAEYSKGELIFQKTAANLIEKMLIVDPLKRISSSEILNHSWFKSCDQTLDLRKHQVQFNGNMRKRINTVESNQEKPGWGNKSYKKALAETCKDNLQIQIKMALRSPSSQLNKEFLSHRKLEKNKENILKEQKSQKNTQREGHNLTKINSLLTNEVKVKAKQRMGGLKTHCKLIDFRKVPMEEKISMSKTHRNFI